MRTNFCPLHKQVELHQTSRSDALRGQNITIAVYGAIDKENPYIAVRMLDEVARRAQFHYTAFVTGGPELDESWTDVLLRSTKNYDLAVDWWARTIPRLSEGIIFPETWYESDTIMITKELPVDDAFVFWSFSFPFSPGLWMLTVFTIICTGLLYYFLDFIHAKADRSNMFSTIDGCIYTSFDSYAGCGSLFAPKSRAGRILTISMAFLYLILISAYTANLTNYYIVKSRPVTTINTLYDVVEKDLLLCVVRGFAKEEILDRQNIPARIFVVESEPDLLVALSDGLCEVGLISMEGFQIYKRDMEYNKHCNLEWIGRRVLATGAGFAIGDSEEYCSSLLDNVIDFHLLQMRKEGKIDEIMQSYRETMTANTCGSRAQFEETKDNSVTVLNMGGAFAFHFCLVAVAIVVGFIDHYRQPKEVKKHISREMRSSFVNSNALVLFSSCEQQSNDLRQLTRNESIRKLAKSESLMQLARNESFRQLARNESIRQLTRSLSSRIFTAENSSYVLGKKSSDSIKNIIGDNKESGTRIFTAENSSSSLGRSPISIRDISGEPEENDEMKLNSNKLMTKVSKMMQAQKKDLLKTLEFQKIDFEESLENQRELQKSIEYEINEIKNYVYFTEQSNPALYLDDE